MVRLFAVLKILLTVVFLAVSCAPPQTNILVRSTTDTPSLTSASVVTLIEPVLLSDDEGVPNGIGYTPICNAFCVERLGTRYLVTAAHCVSETEHGDLFQYLEPNGWGSGYAKLTWKDEVHDNALATVSDPGLIPLVIADNYQPQPFDIANTASSLFGEKSEGLVIGELIPGFYDTTQTVKLGWSGSPVLNEDGNVWGIMSMCRFDNDTQQCKPDYAIVTEIP